MQSIMAEGVYINNVGASIDVVENQSSFIMCPIRASYQSTEVAEGEFRRGYWI